tara:strand:- start:1652 stop:2224 length:573 start_codon:yes stop_codon:yes gene_type:complete
MPEYPDVEVYVRCLRQHIVDRVVEDARVASPFVVRTYDPPLSEIVDKHVLTVDRLGKRIVLGVDDDLHLVIHLMIAGRLRWKERGGKLARKVGLAAFDFSDGSLSFTEAGTKKRASIHFVRVRNAVAEFDRGGIEVFDSSIEDFDHSLKCENHILKRSLTDPRLFSGIGNATPMKSFIGRVSHLSSILRN